MLQVVKVLYCKLPTNSKQVTGRAGNRTPISEVGGESVTTLPPWPLTFNIILMNIHNRMLYFSLYGCYLISKVTFMVSFIGQKRFDVFEKRFTVFGYVKAS